MLLVEDGEAGKRSPLASVKRGRDPPHASSAGPELPFLFLGVFQQSVRRIADYGVNRVRFAASKPFKSVAINNLVQPGHGRFGKKAQISSGRLGRHLETHYTEETPATVGAAECRSVEPYRCSSCELGSLSLRTRSFARPFRPRRRRSRRRRRTRRPCAGC